MEIKEWVMPTHIIAAAGVVLNDKDEVKVFLEYDGRPTYMSYVTRPKFEMHLKMKV